MKITIDGRLFGLEHGGLGRYTQNLVSELAQIDQENEYILLLRDKYCKSISLPSNWTKVRCEIKHYSLREQIQLRKYFDKYPSDLIHFPHLNVPFNLKKKYVVTIHDMIMHKFSGRSATTLPWYLYGIKRAAYKKIFNSAIKNAHKIIVPSKYVKSDLVRIFGKQTSDVKVTYEGIENSKKSSADTYEVLKKYKINSPFFVYAGNAYPHKNLSRAIEAVVSLNKQLSSPVMFVISSSRNIFTQRLQKLIDLHNAQGYILLAGFVPDEDLNVLFKKSLAFVYPSLEEGFGLPGLEAISAGTLVLTSDIPVFREIYPKTSIFFNPFDFSTIVAAMRQVIDMNLDQRRKLIHESQEFTQKYSWRKMAEETLEVYKEVVSINA